MCILLPPALPNNDEQHSAELKDLTPVGGTHKRPITSVVCEWPFRVESKIPRHRSTLANFGPSPANIAPNVAPAKLAGVRPGIADLEPVARTMVEFRIPSPEEPNLGVFGSNGKANDLDATTSVDDEFAAAGL